MKVLKIILGVIAAVVVLGAGYLMTLPDYYRIEKTTTIDAPPDVVLANIASFNAWGNWSPWAEKDPDAAYTFEGTDSEIGSKMAWVTSLKPENEMQIGTGSMTITGISENESVTYDLAFTQPWEMGSKGGFDLSSDENGMTVVNWYDQGDLPFLMRTMASMMDEMIGPDFEKGLSNLKTLCESQKSEAPANDFMVEETTVESFPFLSMTDSCTVEEIGPTLGKLFGGIMAYCGQNNVTPSGKPFTLYHSWDGKATRLQAGIPVAEGVAGTDEVASGTTYGGSVLKVTYVGPYEGSGSAHEAIDVYAKENGKEIIGSPWEVYVNDPGSEPDPNKYITEVYYPVK